MRFSMCSTWKKDKKIEDIIDYAADIGLEGIEIWDGHIDEYLDRNYCKLKQLKQLLKVNKLVCVAIAPYFNFINEDKAEKSFICAKKCIKYAIGLECKIIRTFLGDEASRNLNDEKWKRCISYLINISKLAEDKNIYFALETHNNNPTDNKEAILRIIGEVKSLNLKVLFDGFNFLIDRLDIMDAFRVLEPHSIHFHMKNYHWEERISTPLHKGDVDFTELFTILKQKKYDGFISFEYFCDNHESLIKESIQWIDSL